MTITDIMDQTGMGELQAYRHLQDRRKAQALYTKERRRQRPQLSQDAANEALRLWQIARLSAKRGEALTARAYYRECLEVLGRG